jgi:hypothetical protein
LTLCRTYKDLNTINFEEKTVKVETVVRAPHQVKFTVLQTKILLRNANTAQKLPLWFLIQLLVLLGVWEGEEERGLIYHVTDEVPLC